LRQDKFPRSSEDITVETDLQQVPDPPSSTAVTKDVCICFQHPRTLLTPGVIQGSDIPVVEMSTGVETAMEEEPRKELNLGWQFDIPNPRNIRRNSWALKYQVSFTGGKGAPIKCHESANIRLVLESDLCKTVREDQKFILGCTREAGVQRGSEA